MATPPVLTKASSHSSTAAAAGGNPSSTSASTASSTPSGFPLRPRAEALALVVLYKPNPRREPNDVEFQLLTQLIKHVSAKMGRDVTVDAITFSELEYGSSVFIDKAVCADIIVANLISEYSGMLYYLLGQRKAIAEATSCLVLTRKASEGEKRWLSCVCSDEILADLNINLLSREQIQLANCIEATISAVIRQGEKKLPLRVLRMIQTDNKSLSTERFLTKMSDLENQLGSLLPAPARVLLRYIVTNYRDRDPGLNDQIRRVYQDDRHRRLFRPDPGESETAITLLLKWVVAMAYSRLKEPDNALALLNSMLPACEVLGRAQDQEALKVVRDIYGLLGRVHKDVYTSLSASEANRRAKQKALEEAITWYRRGAEMLPDDSYCAINMCTLLMLAGRMDIAEEQEVRKGLNFYFGACGDPSKIADYWTRASMFEYFIVEENYSKASEFAKQIFKMPPASRPPTWSLQSTLSNIEMILQHRQQHPSTSSHASDPQFAQHKALFNFWIDLFRQAVRKEGRLGQMNVLVTVRRSETEQKDGAGEQEGGNEDIPCTLLCNVAEKQVELSSLHEVGHTLPGDQQHWAWPPGNISVRSMDDDLAVLLTVTGTQGVSLHVMVPSARARAELLEDLKKMDVVDSRGAPENLYVHSRFRFCRYRQGDSEFFNATPELIGALAAKADFEGLDPEEVVDEDDDENQRLLLGKGGMAAVYKGFLMSTGEIIAIKELDLSPAGKLARALDLDTLRRDIALKPQLKHENLVRVYSVQACGPDRIHMLMEFLPSTLTGFIARHGRIEGLLFRGFLFQLIMGLEFLHSVAIAHLDLKPDNVLMSANNVLKLADFDLASRQSCLAVGKSATTPNTWRFAAPEVILAGRPDQQPVSYAADIWSLACTAVQMATAAVPYADCEDHYVIHQVGERKLRPDLSGLLEDAQNLLDRCLAFDAESRPPASKLQRDEFFSDCRPNAFQRQASTVLIPLMRPQSRASLRRDHIYSV